MDAAFTLVSLRNTSTTLPASSSTERQQPLRQAHDNTNRMAPTSRSLKDEDADLIMSDIYGQGIYDNCNGMNSIGILNDIANYELDEDEAEGRYSFAAQEKGEPAEKSKMRKMSQ